MNPNLTILLVLCGAVLGVAGVTFAVHRQWLAYDIGLWVAMGVVFLCWRLLQPALRGRDELQRRKDR